MSRHTSLYKKIVITTLLITLIIGGIGTVLVSMLTYQETKDISEEHLQNIAELIANQDDGFEDFAVIENDDHQRFATDDGEDGVVIDIFTDLEESNPSLDGRLHPDDIADGDSLQTIDGAPWLVHKKSDDDAIILVRERLDNQKELALVVAMTSLTPFLAAMALLGLGFLWMLWRAFAPIQTLARDIAKRDDNDLSIIKADHLPKEIVPFVEAINTLLTKSHNHIAKQERFIADVSHELRSPLTAIHLQIQRLLKLNHAKQGQHLDFTHELTNLESSVKRNQDMVEQLLMLVRLKSEHKNSTLVSVTSTITDIINLMLPIIDDKSLDIEHIGQPLSMMGDETVIMLLIKNLIQNAIRHTPPNGKITLITAKIGNQDLHDLGTCVIGTRANRTHVLQIIDTGDGMDEVDYQNAFEPFVRLGAERSDSSLGGTGLGLAMVKNICQEMNITLYLSPTTDNRYNTLQAQRGLCVSLVW